MSMNILISIFLNKLTNDRNQAWKVKSRLYRGKIDLRSPEKSRQAKEKYWSKQVENFQVLNGTGPHVRKSHWVRLLARQNRRKLNVQWKPSNRKDVMSCSKVWSVEGVID